LDSELYALEVSNLAKRLPHTPGSFPCPPAVGAIYSEGGGILYVGKASNLYRPSPIVTVAW
jgi:hypothetical protein